MDKGSASSGKELRRSRISYLLSEIWYAGSISRSRLGEITGLTLPSVSRLVQELKNQGVIIEVDKGESSGGRQPSLIRINPQVGVVIGLDLSGIELRGAILEAANQCVFVTQQPFKGMEPDLFRNQVIQLCKDLIMNPIIANRPVLGIGISIPGTVDSEKGIIGDSLNLHLKDYPIGEILQQEFGIPVYLEHDTCAAALAEKYYGAGRGASNLIYVIVSSGIGAGLIINDEVYHGSTGTAGELGHVIVERGGQICACGKHGCLEAIASISSMLINTQNILQRQKGISTQQSTLDKLTVNTLTGLSKDGDPLAQAIIRRSADYLASAINMMVSVMDIPLIIVGGEVVEMGEEYFIPLTESIAIYRGNEPEISVVAATLGENAAIQGVGMIVFEKVLTK